VAAASPPVVTSSAVASTMRWRASLVPGIADL
jgi:hypothetical protein